MSLYFGDPYYFATAVSGLVVFGQIAGVVTLVLMLTNTGKGLRRFLAHRSTLLACVVAVVAVSSSLIFSDFFHMQPCKLCWFQRIFIFPQVILLLMALWKKHHDVIVDYSLMLACIAIPISIFHYLLQMTDAPAVHAFAPCDITGQAPSCSGFYVIIFGYVTIPMMALTASALIAILMMLRKRIRS